MKAWEVVGYTADGEAWCPPCAEARYASAHTTHERRDHEGSAVHPVFAADEWEYRPACGACGTALRVRVVDVRRWGR